MTDLTPEELAKRQADRKARREADEAAKKAVLRTVAQERRRAAMRVRTGWIDHAQLTQASGWRAPRYGSDE